MTTRLSWVGLSVAAAAAMVMAAVQVTPAALHGPMRSANTGSLNWAGAAGAGAKGEFKDVSASWIVPAVTCAPGETSYAIAWVGIDGYNSTTVEQAGTESSCYVGVPTYDAWYEAYPSAPVFLRGLAVHAGDSVDAHVSYAHGQFTFHLAVNGRAVDTSVSDSSAAARSSAEVIVEAPLDGAGSILGFARVSPVSFGNVSINGRGAQARSIDVIDMVARDSHVVAATTTSGNGFRVARA